ncbi:MAG: hypothetical protein U0Q16_08305 [Bryobacteraceae bacterium]
MRPPFEVDMRLPGVGLQPGRQIGSAQQTRLAGCGWDPIKLQKVKGRAGDTRG